MCPGCVTSTATIVAGVTSASGVTALVVKISSVNKAVREILRSAATRRGRSDEQHGTQSGFAR
jgi:Tfp pilus assembly major pilin PilA